MGKSKQLATMLTDAPLGPRLTGESMRQIIHSIAKQFQKIITGLSQK